MATKGLISFFGSPTPKEILKRNELSNTSEGNNSSAEELAQAKELDNKAQEAGVFLISNIDGKKITKRQLIGIENLAGDKERLQTKIDAATTLSSAAAVGSGLVTTLAASGVGMPVAALLAGALLVLNKMLDLYKNNLILRLLMQDAIFIIMDCYLLFSLIEKSYDIIGFYNDPKNTCDFSQDKIPKGMEKKVEYGDFGDIIIPEPKQLVAQQAMTSGEFIDVAKQNKTKDQLDEIQNKTTNVRKYQINQIMQAQLKYQIEKLINTLLSIMETKTLKILAQDPSLQSNAFGILLLAEQDKRKEESYLSFSKFDRNYNRRLGAALYITQIINSLTVINSYIVLLKSNLDTLLKKFEILANETYIIIWRAILCTIEYNSYIKPNTQEVIKMAQSDVRTVDPKQLIKAIEFVETIGQNAEAEASAGGSGRSYVRPRIKRKTERRIKKKSKRRGTKSHRRRQKKSKRRT